MFHEPWGSWDTHVWRMNWSVFCLCFFLIGVVRNNYGFWWFQNTPNGVIMVWETEAITRLKNLVMSLFVETIMHRYSFSNNVISFSSSHLPVRITGNLYHRDAPKYVWENLWKIFMTNNLIFYYSVPCCWRNGNF